MLRSFGRHITRYKKEVKEGMTYARIVKTISATMMVIVMLFGVLQQIPVSEASTTSPLIFIRGFSGSTFVDTINPFTSSYSQAQTIQGLVYPWLVIYSPDLKTIEPYLAQSWNVNVQNGTAIFNLNPNAKWSDGIPITAQDVVYSFNNYLQRWAHYAGRLTMIQSISSPNPSTVVIHFKGIMFQLVVFSMPLPIVPYHVWQNLNASSYDGFTPGSTFVGGGPFLVKSYSPHESVQLVKNPDFFLPTLTPHIDELIFQNFASPTTLFAALQAGQIDSAPVTPTQIPAITNNSKFVLAVSPGTVDHYLAFNMYPTGRGNPALRNINVRHALAYALNMSYLIQLGFRGYAAPAVSLVPPSNPFVNPNLKPWPYDVAKANALLDQAGYKMGPNGVRQLPNGTTLSLSLHMPTGFDNQLAPVFVQFWGKVGIPVTANIVDSGTLGTLQAQYRIDMDIWDWNSDPSWPSELYVHLSSSIPKSNEAGFSDATYDSLNQQMLTSTSIDAARTLSYALQNITYWQMPYLNMFYPDSLTAYSSKWTGVDASLPTEGGVFGLSPYIWNYITLTSSAAAASTTTQSVQVGGGTSVWLYGVIGAVLIVIAAVIILTIRKKRKNE